MRKQKRFQIHDFFAQLCDLRREGVVFRTEDLDLGLEVGQPLLLALAAL